MRRTSVRPPPDDGDEWAKTRALTAMPTQVVVDEGDYLDSVVKDVGRRIDADRHELFVVCDPAEALAQQLVHLAPEFIAMHDVGPDAGASRGLLRMVASALQMPVQTLAIRRQGYGVTLATLEFVELPSPRARASLRLYSTRVDTGDASQRRLLARVLLEHSRLGVVLVEGAQPPARSDRHSGTLIDALMADGWHSRQWLFIPLGAAAAAALPDAADAGRQRAGVLTAAQAAGPAQAWAIIQDVWGQIRAGRTPRISMPVVPAVVPSDPVHARPVHRALDRPSAPERASLPLRPMPAVAPPFVSPHDAPSSPWSDYIGECSAIQGMVSCCVFELDTQRTLAFAGVRPGPASLAAQGAALYQAAAASAKALGLPPGQPDLAISVQEHHLLLHPIAQHPGVLLHAVLDAHVANLTLVRLKLQRIGLPK